MSEEPSGSAELGVGVVDSIGAKRRFEEPDGYRNQADWSRGYLGERTFGALMLLLALPAVFLIVLDFGLAPWLRAIIIAAPVVLLVAMAIARRQSKAALVRLRDETARCAPRPNERAVVRRL